MRKALTYSSPSPAASACPLQIPRRCRWISTAAPNPCRRGVSMCDMQTRSHSTRNHNGAEERGRQPRERFPSAIRCVHSEGAGGPAAEWLDVTYTDGPTRSSVLRLDGRNTLSSILESQITPAFKKKRAILSPLNALLSIFNLAHIQLLPSGKGPPFHWAPVNPFRTPVPLWRQTTQIPSNVFPIVPRTRL